MTPNFDSSEYLKVTEAARLLGVSVRTVYRWIDSGELPAALVGHLYLIKRDDLLARLEQRQAGRPVVAPAGSVYAAETPASARLKCSLCFRLLSGPQQVVGRCRQEECETPLCKTCWQAGERFCARHLPTRQQKYEQALARFRDGAIPLLVKASDARLRELAFLSRLQERVCNVHSLSHPLSGAVVNVADWDDFKEQGDERGEVMRLLDTGVLDAELARGQPLNAWVRYRLPGSKKNPPVEVAALALARLPQMLSEGFDAQPLGAAELSPLLERLAEAASRAQTVTLLTLASQTGWDEGARQALLGGKPGQAFTHRYLWVYLFDLYAWELLYNRSDDRLRRYAELFNPLLPSEEVDAAAAEVEKMLVGYDSLVLEYAASRLPFPRQVLRLAFKRLEQGGRYRVFEDAELGTSLVRSRLDIG
jgi:excisionase family DNA binding protein